MPAERTLSTLYTVLLDTAERVMNRGSLHPDVELERSLVTLNDEIEAAVRKPVEGARLINDEEKLLARCLLRILYARRGKDNERTRLWAQVAGVLVPVVREHFGQALEVGRRNTVATTDQDYVPAKR